MSGWTGLNAVNVKIAGGDVAVTTADTTDVTVGTVKGGSTTVTGAKTVTITNADTTKAVSIEAGTATTSVAVTGGSTVTVSKTATGNDQATKVASVSVDGATGAIDLYSDALTSVSLANLANNTATITNNNAAGHNLALTLNDVGYDQTTPFAENKATVVDKTAGAVNITTTGSKSSIVLTADVATALTLAGDQVLKLDATDLASKDTVKTVTISGAAGLNSDLSGISSLTSVDASASSGANTLTIDPTTALSIKGGSGADSVTLAAKLAATSVVDLGAGDDTLVLAAAADAGAKADGGSGNNTLAAADGSWLSSSVYTNFQTLDVGGGKGTYDMSTMPSLNAVVVTSDVNVAGVAIDKAAAGTTLAFNAAASTDLSVTTGAVSYALKTDTAADSLSIALNAKDGNNDHTADGVVTVGDLTANKIESISIASKVLVLDADDTATVAVDPTTATDYTNTITKLSADAVKTITITGEAKADVTLVTPALTKVDATGNTGGVTVDATDAGNVKAVTFLGGAGDDVYKATANGDLIVGGAGADDITLGAGKDTVRFTSASDSVLSLNDTTKPADGKADTITGIDVIHSFSVGNDKIELSSALGLATGDARTAITQKGDVYAAADGVVAHELQALIGDGAKFFNDGSVNRATAFVSESNDGDGYLFVDVNHDGNFTAGSDLVIKLAGVTALDVNSITFG